MKAPAGNWRELERGNQMARREPVHPGHTQREHEARVARWRVILLAVAVLCFVAVVVAGRLWP